MVVGRPWGQFQGFIISIMLSRQALDANIARAFEYLTICPVGRSRIRQFLQGKKSWFTGQRKTELPLTSKTVLLLTGVATNFSRPPWLTEAFLLTWISNPFCRNTLTFFKAKISSAAVSSRYCDLLPQNFRNSHPGTNEILSKQLL